MITGQTSLRVEDDDIYVGLSITKINAPVTTGVTLSAAVMDRGTQLWWNGTAFILENEPALSDADQYESTNIYELKLTSAYDDEDKDYLIHLKSVGEVPYETYINDRTTEAAKANTVLLDSIVEALRKRGFRRENISREMILKEIKAVFTTVMDNNKQWKRLNNSSKKVQ